MSMSWSHSDELNPEKSSNPWNKKENSTLYIFLRLPPKTVIPKRSTYVVLVVHALPVAGNAQHISNPRIVSRALAVLTVLGQCRGRHSLRKDRRELFDWILHIRSQLVAGEDTSAGRDGQRRAEVEPLLWQADLLSVLGAALELLQVVLRVRLILVKA